MTGSLYLERDSPIHRLSPGVKLVALVVVGSAVFVVGGWRGLLAILAGVVVLYAAARLGWRVVAAQIRPALLTVGLFAVVQGLAQGWFPAVLLVLRLGSLILLAALVTLTTRVSATVATIERATTGLRRFGVNPAKVSLAFSLTLRFIPVIAALVVEVREAQRVRGLDRSIVAVVIPVVIRTLKMADDIADAVDARSFGG